MAKSDEGKEKKRHPWEDIPDFTIYFYDPVASLFSGNEKAFIDYEGKPVIARKETKQILGVASEAADVLLRELDVTEVTWEEWKDFLKDTRAFLNYVRADFPLDRIKFVNEAGEEVEAPARHDISPSLIATFLEESSAFPDAPESLTPLVRQLWCLVCLTNVDSALLAQLYEDAGDALGSFADAAEALRKARGPDDRNRSMAIKGAMARLAADPKQAEKRAVRECWELWRQDPGRYDGKAAFARDMLHKFETLQSAVVIERWCRAWERELEERSGRS
jgi:hypothetical protein